MAQTIRFLFQLVFISLFGAFCSAAWADDFHFGEENGASLGAKIENGRLIYALKNYSNRPRKYMVHMYAQVTMYDNLDLVVIDQNQTVHHFGFVDERDKSFPVFKTLEPGELYQESIDLLDWNRRNAKNNSFSFRPGETYHVFLHYLWDERTGTAETLYGALDSKVFAFTFKAGVFFEVKE